MNYSARTDLTIVNTPTPPPAPVVNTIVTDPDFGTRILRATDATTIHNASLTCGSAGASQVWNVNSTRFFANTPGGGNIIVAFDPVAFQTGATLVLPVGDLHWSHIDPSVIFTVSKGVLEQYTLAADLSGFTTQFIFDFNTVISPIKWQSIFTVSEDDNAFGIGFSTTGGQGTGSIACSYVRDRGVRTLDISTGIVSGQWGIFGTINLPDRFLLHEVSMSKAGDYLILGKSVGSTIQGDPNGSVYFWDVLGLDVQYIGGLGAPKGGGHPAQGYKFWMNPSGTPVGAANLRPYANLNQVTTVCTTVPSPLQHPLDSHCSWHDSDMLDTKPFCIITTSYPTPAANPNTSAWVNEILLYDPVTNSVFRQGHVFSSQLSKYFGAQQNVGTISQDGRYVICPSDWMQTLGPDQSGEPRSDVFIWELH